MKKILMISLFVHCLLFAAYAQTKPVLLKEPVAWQLEQFALPPSGKEVTLFFIRENKFCSILHSFTNRVVANESIQAACDAEVLARYKTFLMRQPEIAAPDICITKKCKYYGRFKG